MTGSMCAGGSCLKDLPQNLKSPNFFFYLYQSGHRCKWAQLSFDAKILSYNFGSVKDPLNGCKLSTLGSFIIIKCQNDVEGI